MLTKQQAQALKYGAVLHHRHLKNADGTPLRIRVNGRCQVWKTRPEEWRLPCKYGLRDYVQVTQRDAADWEVA